MAFVTMRSADKTNERRSNSGPYISTVCMISQNKSKRSLIRNDGPVEVALAALPVRLLPGRHADRVALHVGHPVPAPTSSDEERARARRGEDVKHTCLLCYALVDAYAIQAHWAYHATQGHVPLEEGKSPPRAHARRRT